MMPTVQPSSLMSPDRRERGMFTLVDGTAVRYRSLRSGDVPGLLHFYAELSLYSRYLRFFAPVSILDAEQVRRVSHLDGPHQFGFIVRDPTDLARVVAVAGCNEESDASGAEFTVTVADAWQGRGLGRALTRQLIAAARRRGVRSLVAFVLPENARMLRILVSLGLPMRRTWEGGYLRIEITLASADRLCA